MSIQENNNNNSSNYMWIIGFGSLLSKNSSLSSFPNLIDFQVVKVKDYRRVFQHVAEIFLERGIANLDTKEMSSLSVEYSEYSEIICTLFRIPSDSYSAFLEREREFEFIKVKPYDLNDNQMDIEAIMCGQSNDETFKSIRCNGSEEEFYNKIGKYGIDRVWREDIYPCRVYLRHCLLAAEKLGNLAYENFLDSTYLGNRNDTIRTYLKREKNKDILDEKPPLSLINRYNG
eukprot:TRINITY_DN13823_c0_g1_i1.p1 TRINITY_DN13823_c0_g1~~TRINITY_DN13823_c0_g1_i1.p1  ORF type:complete len:231 (+),score=48.64 TRINITY_DN13823_c0_g1_i1:131-823(+)